MSLEEAAHSCAADKSGGLLPGSVRMLSADWAFRGLLLVGSRLEQLCPRCKVALRRKVPVDVPGQGNAVKFTLMSVGSISRPLG